MKFVVLGTTSITLAMANGILDSGYDVSLMVGLENDLLPDNSVAIDDYCSSMELKYIACRKIDQNDTLRKIEQTQPDIILSSWPHFIPNEVLKIPKLGAVGSHPTPLPYGRGRHPIHWSIVMGIDRLDMCFFWMDNGFDTGNILMRVPFEVGSLHIDQVMKNLEDATYNGVKRLCNDARKQRLGCGENQKIGGTVWPKRTLDDVVLDPRLTAKMIISIVRSFSEPYGCALLYVSCGKALKIKNAIALKRSQRPANWSYQAHGYVFDYTENTITIRVADAVVVLSFDCHKFFDDPPFHIRPPSYYIRCSV